jgi:hypothetical protein
MKLSIRDLKEITRLLLGVQHLTRREQIIEVHITIRVLKILDQKLELIENLRTGHQVAVQDQVLQEVLLAQAPLEVALEVAHRDRDLLEVTPEAVRRDPDLLEATAEAVHRDLGPLEVIALDLREVLAQ